MYSVFSVCHCDVITPCCKVCIHWSVCAFSASHCDMMTPLWIVSNMQSLKCVFVPASRCGMMTPRCPGRCWVTCFLAVSWGRSKYCSGIWSFLLFIKHGKIRLGRLQAIARFHAKPQALLPVVTVPSSFSLTAQYMVLTDGMCSVWLHSKWGWLVKCVQTDCTVNCVDWWNVFSLTAQ